jgi:hypothetical protein
MYASDAQNFPYMLLYMKNRLGGPLLPKLSPNLTVESQYRTVEFKSTTSNILMIYLPSDGCLQVIDPLYVSEDAFPNLPKNLTNNIGMSNISQIEKSSGNSANLTQYFGTEPPHTWCYYFEKAELARQTNDWEEVIQNYEYATSAGYTALLPAENLVFIEALARRGNVERAEQLTDIVISQDRKLCKALVSVWERALEASPEINADILKTIETLKDFPDCN